MRPTWLAGIVPYELDGAVPAELADSVRTALERWEGTPVLSYRIEFSPAALRGIPTLRFGMDAGCGAVRRAVDSVSFALGACRNEVEIAREIGVTLGLPRMHQRSDRELHLDLAPASAFDCTRGQFYAKCPVESAVGPFLASSILFAPANSVLPPERCDLEPNGSYLYLRRDVDREGARVRDCEAWVGDKYRSTTPLRSTSDGVALAELYGTARGWRLARPLAPEPPPALEPSRVMAGSTYHPLHLAEQVTTGPGKLVLFASLLDPELPEQSAIYSVESADGVWGSWRRRTQWAPLSISNATVGVRNDGSLDIVVASSTNAVFHAHVVGDAAADWRVIGQQMPPGSPVLAHNGGSELAVYVPTLDGLFFAQGEAHETLSSWETLGLPADAIATGRPMSVRQGSRHHLVVPLTIWNSRRPEALAVDTVVFYTRDESGVWSAPFRLAPSVSSNFATISVSPEGRLDVFLRTGDGEAVQVWQLSCAAACQKPTSWSRPSLIGGMFWLSTARSGADGIELMGAETTGPARLWYEKRWSAPSGMARTSE